MLTSDLLFSITKQEFMLPPDLSFSVTKQEFYEIAINEKDYFFC